jgi:hypothetical protein
MQIAMEYTDTAADSSNKLFQNSQNVTKKVEEQQ